MQRRFLSIAVTAASVVALTATSLALLALPAGAASCSSTLNVNLGSGCAGVASLSILGPETRAGGTTCTGAGCADFDSGTTTAPAPVVRHRPQLSQSKPEPAAPATTLRRESKPAVRVAPAYRVNRFDAARSEVAGGFSLHLPFPAEMFNRPVVSPIAPAASEGSGWQVPAIPVQIVVSLLGGLMLLASAGGVRRMMAAA